jgi:putative ABC transport system permease protein
MFRNNLLIAWRNIKKHKGFSFINIAGLAAGMAVFILIILFVRNELSYDRYHPNASNIYRVITKNSELDYMGSNISAQTPGAVAPAVLNEFPEVRAAARIMRTPEVLLNRKEKNFMENGFIWADSQIFDIFSFPPVQGDRISILKEPFSVLLSERAAMKYFGSESPLGQTISYHLRDRTFDLKIVGIFRNIPSNSHFIMDFVAPLETLAKIQPLFKDYDTNWTQPAYYTYILLKKGTSASTLDRKLPGFIKKHIGPNASPGFRMILQPLTSIHLESRANFEISPTGDAGFVLLFASIAVLVLVIASVSYMNLATARSLKRAKEVGLRKVVGAARAQLVRQFLSDSMMQALFALILAVGIVLAVLPAFRTFVGREIAFDPLRDITLVLGLILLASTIGAVAGSYPAFFVSAFRPVSALKGTGASRSKGRGLRNALIVFQFAASIALIICTVGVRSQLRYIRIRDMGYQRDQVLVLSLRHGIQMNIDIFKTELKRNLSILNVAASSSLPNDISTFAKPPGLPGATVYVQYVDYDFIDLYGIEIVQGRKLSREFPSDANRAILINEFALKLIGWDDPIGREFELYPGSPTRRIVGVIKDFNMHSLHHPIAPLFVHLDSSGWRHISIKIRSGDIPSTLAFIRKTWERFAPEYPFEYSFFDEIFDRVYRTEHRVGTIFSAFAGLAVLIACLGLIGLAAFAAEQKTKEIGIRKVLGASTAGVIALLSRDFMKWVVAANFIAWPIGYFAMRSWLNNFAYRTSLTVPMFLGAALAAFLIAAASISLQTYRAAAANPARSMRYE